MDLRILIAAGAILLSGPLHAQENIALNKPVIEVGATFGTGDFHLGVPPEVVTDGNFLPGGDSWFNGSWWLDWECTHFPPPTPEDPAPPPEPCALEIDLQDWFHIDSFIFQGDSDAYLLQYWVEDPPHWELAWAVPSVGPAIQTRPNPGDNVERWFLLEPIVTNRLRVQVNPDGDHDGWNSVSEVQAFGEPGDPCAAMGGTSVGSGCWSGEREFKAHIAAGELCYRFELSCDGFVNSGFGACVYPNGFFDFGLSAQIGDPHEPVPEEPGCGLGGVHMLNDKVEHSCSLDGQGKVQLKVKEVGMVHCDTEE